MSLDESFPQPKSFLSPRDPSAGEETISEREKRWYLAYVEAFQSDNQPFCGSVQIFPWLWQPDSSFVPNSSLESPGQPSTVDAFLPVEETPYYKPVSIIGNEGKECRSQTPPYAQYTTMRITLKMEVSYTDHSHLIGIGGKTIRPVMTKTGCHIHFPDCNMKLENCEKNNHVLVMGRSVESVEEGRASIRDLTPLVLQFKLPLCVTSMENNSDAHQVFLEGVRAKHEVEVIVYPPSKQHHSGITVKGRVLTCAKVREAILEIVRYFSGGQEINCKDVVVESTMDISSDQHQFVRGDGDSKIQRIMQNTGAHIVFPDLADTSLDPVKRTRVNISGEINAVCIARQQLIDGLPIRIIFDIAEDMPLNWSIMRKISTEYYVRVKVLNRENAMNDAVDLESLPAPFPGMRRVVVQAAERTVGNIYEARRRIQDWVQFCSSNKPPSSSPVKSGRARGSRQIRSGLPRNNRPPLMQPHNPGLAYPVGSSPQSPPQGLWHGGPPSSYGPLDRSLHPIRNGNIPSNVSGGQPSYGRQLELNPTSELRAPSSTHWSTKTMPQVGKSRRRRRGTSSLPTTPVSRNTYGIDNIASKIRDLRLKQNAEELSQLKPEGDALYAKSLHLDVWSNPDPSKFTGMNSNAKSAASSSNKIEDSTSMTYSLTPGPNWSLGVTLTPTPSEPERKPLGLVAQLFAPKHLPPPPPSYSAVCQGAASKTNFSGLESDLIFSPSLSSVDASSTANKAVGVVKPLVIQHEPAKPSEADLLLSPPREMDQNRPPPPMDLRTLLMRNGLEKYVGLFQSEEVELSDFIFLTETDFEMIGVKCLYTRKKMCQMVVSLNRELANQNAQQGKEK